MALADVSSEGIGSNYRALHLAKSFDPIKPGLLLPEVTDESLWYQGKHRYIDPEGQFVFRYVGTQQQGNIAYNTKLVNPKEISSLWDFVDARWKGKIIARDVRVPGPGSAPMRFYYHHSALGPTFIKKLFGELDVTLFRDFRQSIDWLASGKASRCSSAHTLRRFLVPVMPFSFSFIVQPLIRSELSSRILKQRFANID